MLVVGLLVAGLAAGPVRDALAQSFNWVPSRLLTPENLEGYKYEWSTRPGVAIGPVICFPMNTKRPTWDCAFNMPATYWGDGSTPSAVTFKRQRIRGGLIEAIECKDYTGPADNCSFRTQINPPATEPEFKPVQHCCKRAILSP
jgi:hypothetical protein